MHDVAILRVQLLGAFQVAIGEQLVPTAAWRRKRGAAVVKLLALEPTHRLHREQVLEALWPTLDAEFGARNLRVALHYARQRLAEAGAPPGTFLVRDGASLLLGPSQMVDVDVDAFDGAASRAWRVDDPETTEAALERYAGVLLPEDPYEEWAERRRVELRSSYLALLARLARLVEERGDLDRAIAALQRILTVEPAQEEAHAALMRLFAVTGRRTEALDQYRQMVAVLEREVGAAPEPSTRVLHDAIRGNQFPARDASRTTPSPADWTNVPTPVDTLVGREREVGEICRLLATSRLVTLTGPGGVGKTRLALAVARDVNSAFPDGICFVDLAPARDAPAVVSAIAQALGVYDTGRQPQAQALATSLRGKRLLILLDNFEQVVEAAPVLVNLLGACPDLKALVTSRVRLRVSGERERTVPPLALVAHDQPVSVTVAAQSEAVRLFVERARAVRHDFAVAEENVSAVAAICRRLEGLPLAIELAAARAKVLPPAALLDRLETRLPLLTGGGRDLPERQRTMRDTIAWSYDLLAPAEQMLFRRLAVFVGGFTLGAAEAVAIAGTLPDELLEAVTSLVDNSLLREEDGPGGEPRFTMLETVREFAHERLTSGDELEGVLAAHATWYLALAERAESGLWGPDQQNWLDRLDAEHDNLRAALDWCLARDPEAGLRLATALSLFWQVRGYLGEGRRWLEALLATTRQRTASRANALHAAAQLARHQADTASGVALSEESLAIHRELGDRRGDACVLRTLGLLVWDGGDLARGRALFEESLSLSRETGDNRGIARTLATLGCLALVEGDHRRARDFLEGSLALFQRLRDRRSVAVELGNLGHLAWDEGDQALARSFLEANLALGREIGNKRATAYALAWLGNFSRSEGDYRRARELLAESLEFHGEIGDKLGISYCLCVRGVLAVEQSDFALGARLLGAAFGLHKPLEVQLTPRERAARDAALATARSVLGEEVFVRAWADGWGLPLEEAVAEASVLAGVLAAQVD